MARKKKSPTSWWMAVAILCVGLLSFLSNLQTGSLTLPNSPDGHTPGQTTGQGDAETVRIASFNIQVFGQSKLKQAQTMTRLAEVIRQFDLVAIQEIRSIEQNVMPEFVKIINAQGGDYEFLIGPRLGRTVSKEQYAYVYRSSKIEPVSGSIYTIEDPRDLLHREPYIASFRTRNTGTRQPYSFTLINMHTDPDEAEWEVNQLADVYRVVAGADRNEDDIILLGDLNVDNSKLTRLTNIPQLASIVPEGPTNTRGTKQYDHIIINQLTTQEFTGRAGVMDMAKMFQITPEQALELSDHQPVWAEFSIYENTSPIQLANPGRETIVR